MLALAMQIEGHHLSGTPFHDKAIWFPHFFLANSAEEKGVWHQKNDGKAWLKKREPVDVNLNEVQERKEERDEEDTGSEIGSGEDIKWESCRVRLAARKGGDAGVML